MSLELRAVSTARLQQLTLLLEPGMHVVIGAPHDGTLELLGVAAGATSPTKGGVLVTGNDPFRHPATRRRIACALSAPPLEERSVQAAMSTRLNLRGSLLRPQEVCERFGIEPLLARRPSDLSESERQAILLAIALSIEAPVLVALYEPLFQSLLAIEVVLDALSKYARKSVVLCATASPRAAALLSPDAVLLQDGRMMREIVSPTRPAFAATGPARIRIESEACAALAHAVSGDPAVSGIHWEAGSNALYLEGPETERLCLLVVAKATQHQLTIRQLSQVLPEPAEIRATHAALARAAFERAYSARTRGAPATTAPPTTRSVASATPPAEVEQ